MTQAAKKGPGESQSIEFKVFFQDSASALSYPELEEKKEELAWSEEVEEEEENAP